MAQDSAGQRHNISTSKKKKRFTGLTKTET